MEWININLSFNSKEEMDAWEKEHIIDGKYEGKKVVKIIYDVTSKGTNNIGTIIVD